MSEVGLYEAISTLRAVRRLRPLLGIPRDRGRACAIPIGYPRRGGHGPIRRRPTEKMVYADRWRTSLG